MVNKKILFFASAFFLIILLANVSGFAGGTGTSTDPYQISTCQELQDINTDVIKNYKLINDINCDVAPFNTGSGFSPIGSLVNPFTGTFDGDNHIISGLFINRQGGHCGLFALVISNSVIKDVGLTDINLTCTGGSVGGLVGSNQGDTISNSYVTGIISGTFNVGGLAGDNYYGTITSSYADVDISATDKGIGGLVGSNNAGGIISNSYSKGNVMTSSGSGGSQSGIGGLVGNNDDNLGYPDKSGGQIINSYSTGNVNAPNMGGLAGGLVGTKGVGVSPGSCINSFWDTQTSGKTISAGYPTGCGTGKTTAQMTQHSTYNAAGWDFTNVWTILNGQYPCFSWNNCIPVPPAYWTSDSSGQNKIITKTPSNIPDIIYLVAENVPSQYEDLVFEIWEKDAGADDEIRTIAKGNSIINYNQIGNKIIAEWTITQADINAAESDDFDGTYEFYFKLYDDSKSPPPKNITESPILNLEWNPVGQPPQTQPTQACSDGIKNQGETGIDCGGQCPACISEACLNDIDCQSGNCVNDICEAQPEDGLDCSQYTLCSDLSKTECEKGIIADSCQLGPQNVDCTNPNINCGCSWNSGTNSCNSYSEVFSDSLQTNSLGTCTFQETKISTCESSGYLEYEINVIWSGAPETAEENDCISGTVGPIICSAKTRLPLENKYGILLTIISIIGIYFLFFRKKQN